MHNLPVINSHNSWSRLEEVWLGDVYPASWYDFLEPEVRDAFREITQITQTDLDQIQQTIESFGVTVQRPQYKNQDDFMNSGYLIKPEICPRDTNCVIGNQLLSHYPTSAPWQHVMDQYRQDSRCLIEMPQGGNLHHINGANIVRAGRDLYIDSSGDAIDISHRFTDYRVHMIDNGGHIDGCFAILKPGLILANYYYEEYETTFPGWEIIYLKDPTYADHLKERPYPDTNAHWYIPGFENDLPPSFNAHLAKHAQTWTGSYTETFFELNCLVIDESNVVMLAKNEALAETLNRHGITVHWIPFRARGFWDGGVHCVTLDIRRQSAMEDFFPERG